MRLKLRIWHLMMAMPLMAIAAGMATLIAPKDKPLLFGLIWIDVIGSVVGIYALGRWVVIPIYRGMGQFYRRFRNPGLRSLLARIFLVIVYFYVGIWVAELAILIAVGVSSLPIILLFYLDWL